MMKREEIIERVLGLRAELAYHYSAGRKGEDWVVAQTVGAHNALIRVLGATQDDLVQCRYPWNPTDVDATAEDFPHDTEAQVDGL